METTNYFEASLILINLFIVVHSRVDLGRFQGTVFDPSKNESKIMTLIYYIFLCLVTIIYASYDKRSFYNYYFIYILLIFWSGITRNFAAKIDIITYMRTMTYETDMILGDWYYLREPVYWLSSHFLYLWLNNAVYVFILLDSIIFYILVFGSYKFNIKPYFILLFVLFFSNIMGFLNIYRQFVAGIFLFLSFIYVFQEKNIIKSRIIYSISFFTHNVSGVFLPLLFLKNNLLQGLKFWFSVLIALLLMIILSDSKSVGITGETSPVLFVIVMILIYINFILLNNFKINKENNLLHYLNLYCILLSIISTVFLSNLAAKRISMISLIFALYSIYWCIEKMDKRNQIVLRIFFICLAILPTFIFSSAFNMLTVNDN